MREDCLHKIQLHAIIAVIMVFCTFSARSQLIINEVHADPASDLPGDANGDGTRSASDDEFIEFVNIGNSELDISGWQVLDTNSTLLVRHVFPENTVVPAREAIVVFGGGTPTGEFGGSIVQLASSGSLGISNSNEMLLLVNAAEDTVIRLGYDDFNGDASFVRYPELTGPYTLHSELSEASGALYSPGTKTDGSMFLFDQLVINEVHADPASDITGDANGDGTRDALDDEFLEFINAGTSVLDISGWQVLDTNSSLQVRHVFPEGSKIEPHETLIVFGGGTPTGDFGGATVQLASTGSLGLSNSNEMLLIVNAAEDTIMNLSWESFNGDASFVRSPEVTGEFVIHTDVAETLFSPGTKSDGAGFVFDQLVINEVLADPASDLPGDANGDGTRSASDDEFIEFVNNGITPLDLTGWQILDTNSTLLVRHIFPDNSVIPPGEALVVFGGGTPTGEFGGSVVQTSSTGSLGISNTSEMLVIVNFAGDTLIRLGYDDFNSDMSWTRDPDITGEFVQHSSATGADGVLFSPGTKINGGLFGLVSAENLIINEVHADPASDISGDANGDGTRDALDDEFIEFVNSAAVDLDITGWQILDTNSVLQVRHIFPENSVIPGGGALVVFGGGTPTGTFGNSIVQVASTGSLGLSNSNEEILIVDAGEDTVLVMGWADYNGDVSYTRNPDFTGDFVGHSSVASADGALFSPGKKVDGSFFIAPDSTIIQFTASGASVKEGDGTTTIEVSINAPSSTQATTVDLVLVEGDASDIEDFTTASLSFAAGSSETNTVTITITDDAEIESADTLVFELQNLAGGESAKLGDIISFMLIVEDNDFATTTLVINEFMAWPAGQDSQAGEDPTVDSNGDGGIDIYEDEFIEFVNSGTENLDISGWKIYDDVTSNDPLRHTFESGTVINPGGALIVFGGGNPTGEFGGTPWVLSNNGTQGLGMTNSGDIIIVKNASDETVIELAFGQQKRATSTTLNPDITGALGPHPELNGLNISPGTKVDGSPFAVPTNTVVSFAKSSGGIYEKSTESLTVELKIERPDDTNATTVEVDILSTNYESDLTFTKQTLEFPAGSSDNLSFTLSAIDDELLEGDELFRLGITAVSGGNAAKKGSVSTFEFQVVDDDVPLIFNEIHADPAPGEAGDANGDLDSNEDLSDDEFVEIVNPSETETIDMSGWELYDSDGLRHVFGVGTELAPGKAIVVFGSGIPAGTFGGSIVELSSSGNLGLDDTGDTLSIIDGSGALKAKTIYGATAGDNQSISRDPEYTGGFVKHSTIEGAEGALYSPGTAADGSELSRLVLTAGLVKDVTVYPNPATEYLIYNNASSDENIQLYIYNLNGKLVKLSVIRAGEMKRLEVSDMSNGTYIYRVRNQSNEIIKQGKVIIAL
ncbi:MAG: hypothetical protein CMB80_08690 [Flammeovirgaceae bacterium]|nr:hypothetical protein [Flammeovirgaceae bacterium]HCX24070.1 hypothetical protein [Cytophagales bacterium]